MKKLGIRIYPSDIQKARDFSKLTRKEIINKNGHRQTVYVRLGLPVKENAVAGKGGKVEGEKVNLLETDEEKQLSAVELKEKCLNYVRQHFQGKEFINKVTGRKIMVSREGIGEWKMKSKTREQVLSIKILDKLLENAAHDHDAPDEKGRPNIEKFSYFKQPCIINGTPFTAIISVKRTMPYGDKYYHHYLEDIKIEPCSGTAPTFTG